MINIESFWYNYNEDFYVNLEGAVIERKLPQKEKEEKIADNIQNKKNPYINLEGMLINYTA